MVVGIVGGALDTVGGARRRLCRCGVDTDDDDDDGEFVRSLLAIIVRSSFCTETAIQHNINQVDFSCSNFSLKIYS